MAVVMTGARASLGFLALVCLLAACTRHPMDDGAIPREGAPQGASATPDDSSTPADGATPGDAKTHDSATPGEQSNDGATQTRGSAAPSEQSSESPPSETVVHSTPSIEGPMPTAEGGGGRQVQQSGSPSQNGSSAAHTVRTPKLEAGSAAGSAGVPHDNAGNAGLGLTGIGAGGGGYGVGIGQLSGTGQGFGSGHGRLSGSRAVQPRFNTESYQALEETGFMRTSVDARSTFSIDVDTASYSLVRRHLEGGQTPPQGAVRVEEMLNYFSYDYPEPDERRPFSVSSELSRAPWNQAHKLLKLGIKARHIDISQRPDANLVFLIDVSGSMQSPDKLPLLKHGLSLLSEQLTERDRVSIVVYAGASGMVLPATAGSEQHRIREALARLEAGGSTNGAAGIQLAYAAAQSQFKKGGINRVILATDGDFNVGVTNRSELVRLIESKAKGGVFLNVLGFGRGNYKDDTLEQLADRGNGSYAYIDSSAEARKVLVEQASGTLITVAKDVKLQLEFNPSLVAGFRLIGYENRRLEHQDFADDKKDAGEIGADHTVTALYEIVPQGVPVPASKVAPSKYQKPAALTDAARSNELLTVHLRYKPPASNTSKHFSVTVQDGAVPLHASSEDFRFAAAVAEFGLLLSDSKYRGAASYERVLANARTATRGRERRQEFVGLARKARALAK